MDFTDLFNMLDIYQRSNAHLPLTPSERAWLKMMKGVLDAVLFALLAAAVQFFAAHQSFAGINWQAELLIFATIALKAFKDARGKWASSQAPEEAKTGQMMSSVARGFGSAAGPTPISQQGNKGAA